MASNMTLLGFFAVFDVLVRVAQRWNVSKGKGKFIPYSLPSVGSGAGPGVQAFSPR